MNEYTLEEQRNGLLIDLAASLEREDALKVQRDELQARANHYEADNGKQAEMLNSVIQQRDDLLAALEDLQVRYTTLFGLYATLAYHESSKQQEDLDIALATSNSAIAKVKPC